MPAYKLPKLPHEETETAKKANLAPKSRRKQPDLKPDSDRGFRPGKWLLTLSCLALALGGGGLIANAFDGSMNAAYEDAISAYEVLDSFDTRPVSVYINSDNKPVVTFEITKTNPLLDLSSGWGKVKLGSTVVESYLDLPRLGPNTDKAWRSFEADIHYTPDELDQLQPSDFVFNPDADSFYGYNFSEYLSDEDSSEDPDVLKRIYRAQYPEEYPALEVIDDGQNSSDHAVRYKVTPYQRKYEDGSAYGSYFLYQPAEIVFKKDGQVVYSDLLSIENDFEENPGDLAGFEEIYKAPYSLPEYDSVEIFSLS